MDWKLAPAKQLAGLATQWDDLQAKTLPHAFLRSDFLLCLLDQFGQGNELLAYREQGGAWTAALLLQPQGKGRWNSFQPSQLPLGPADSPEAIPVSNPLSADESHLRSRLLPGLLRRVEYNWSQGNRDVRLFEVGTVFRRPDGQTASNNTSTPAVRPSARLAVRTPPPCRPHRSGATPRRPRH